MAMIDKKYQEDFQKLVQDWERLIKTPSTEYYNLVMQDLKQFETDLNNIKF